MRWDLAGSSLGDSPKESGSSLGTRREIDGKKTGGLTVKLPEVAGVCESENLGDGQLLTVGKPPKSVGRSVGETLASTCYPRCLVQDRVPRNSGTCAVALYWILFAETATPSITVQERPRPYAWHRPREKWVPTAWMVLRVNGTLSKMDGVDALGASNLFPFASSRVVDLGFLARGPYLVLALWYSFCDFGWQNTDEAIPRRVLRLLCGSKINTVADAVFL
ncbi:hypothetical protein B296_00029371 [Ensete ventricosum]|uniref:Uncharacterized protein n=1 Tax=Ensete ventricosum TaxID=4639 RepID=A0A426YKA9_ENSVE|nr:hypothetical protein B296_00029371 [Ensete ventricosum]